MLRIVAFFGVLCLGAGSFSVHAKQAHVRKSSAEASEAPKASKALSGVRSYEGIIQSVGVLDKLSLWWQNCKNVRYCLCRKNKPIAFLMSPKDVHKRHRLKALVNRNVCVKGVPQYINKEPYLVIVVEDVCP